MNRDSKPRRSIDRYARRLLLQFPTDIGLGVKTMLAPIWTRRMHLAARKMAGQRYLQAVGEGLNKKRRKRERGRERERMRYIKLC